MNTYCSLNCSLGRFSSIVTALESERIDSVSILHGRCNGRYNNSHKGGSVLLLNVIDLVPVYKIMGYIIIIIIIKNKRREKASFLTVKSCVGPAKDKKDGWK